MTITTLPTRNEYTATAGQTVFTYTFKIFESSDLNVYQTPAGAVSNDITDLITGYVVTGVGDEDGGTITLSTPASSGDLITIVSDIPESRTTDYQNNGDFRPDVVNDDFDRVVSLVKQINDNESRTLSFQESQQGASGLSLPKPSAGLLLRWNGAEDGLENVDFATPVDISIASVTALRNLSESDTYADGTIVSVLGYYSNGDGAGGQFYWDSTSIETDNGGTIIKVTTVTTGRWKRDYTGDMNALWFGLVPDGITDNTSSIDNLITYLATSGEACFLPDGQYASTGNHVVNFDNFCLYANSWNAEFIFNSSGANDYFLWLRKDNYQTAGQANWIRGCTLRGFKINQAGSVATTFGKGVKISRGAQNNVVERLEIAEGKQSLEFEGCLETTIEKNYLHEQNSNSVYFHPESVTGNTGTTNLLKHNIISSSGGIGVYGEDQKSLWIETNIFEQSALSAIILDGGSSQTISTNHLESNNTSESATLGMIQITDATTTNIPSDTNILYNRITGMPVAAPRAVHIEAGTRTRIVGNYKSSGEWRLNNTTDVVDVWIMNNNDDTYAGSATSTRQNGIGTVNGAPTAVNWHPGDLVQNTFTTPNRLYVIEEDGTSVKYATLDS